MVCLPERGEGGTGKGYRRLLGLCSHEYFHLWNVKRMKPVAGNNSREFRNTV